MTKAESILAAAEAAVNRVIALAESDGGLKAIPRAAVGELRGRAKWFLAAARKVRAAGGVAAQIGAAAEAAEAAGCIGTNAKPRHFVRETVSPGEPSEDELDRI